MLTLVVQHHPNRTIPHLRRKLVRRFARHSPFLSGVGASGKSGAVQFSVESVHREEPTMRRSRFSEQQIIGILKEYEAGQSALERGWATTRPGRTRAWRGSRRSPLPLAQTRGITRTDSPYKRGHVRGRVISTAASIRTHVSPLPLSFAAGGGVWSAARSSSSIIAALVQENSGRETDLGLRRYAVDVNIAFLSVAYCVLQRTTGGLGGFQSAQRYDGRPKNF